MWIQCSQPYNHIWTGSSHQSISHHSDRGCLHIHPHLYERNDEINQFPVLKTEEKSDSGTKWGLSPVSFLEQRSDSVWCWTRANSRRTVDTTGLFYHRWDGTIHIHLLSATGGPVRGALQHAFQRNHVMDADTPEFRSAPSINHVFGSRVRCIVPWNDLPADVVVCEGCLDRS